MYKVIDIHIKSGEEWDFYFNVYYRDLRGGDGMVSFSIRCSNGYKNALLHVVKEYGRLPYFDSATASIE